MRFDTDTSSTSNSPDHEQERDRQQRLPYLINQLGELAPDVPDDDLREEIFRWRVLAMRLPTDPQTFVEGQLQELKDGADGHPMYRERGKDNDECFPPTCLDNCRHAEQQACPMHHDMDTIRRRRRIREGDPSPDEYIDGMQTLAADVDCHVAAQAIAVVQEYHGPIIRYGQHLLAQVREDVMHANRSEALAQEIASMDLEQLADDAGIDLPSADDLDEADLSPAGESEPHVDDAEDDLEVPPA